MKHVLRPRPFSHRTAKLVALNLILLAGVGMTAAYAWGQPGATTRGRGSYTMLSGKTTAGGWHAVYVVDGTNQDLVALRWDPSRGQIVGLGYRDLRADSVAQPGR